jgi:hypothetical protein
VVLKRNPAAARPARSVITRRNVIPPPLDRGRGEGSCAVRSFAGEVAVARSCAEFVFMTAHRKQRCAVYARDEALAMVVW